jgi:hypothetical protein
MFCDQLHFHHIAEDQAMWPPVRANLAVGRRLECRHPAATLAIAERAEE